MIVTITHRSCYIRAMYRVRIALAAAALAAAYSPDARAQTTTVQARGTVAVTYTDNSLAAPADPLPGEPASQEDVFLQLTPGIVLYHETPRLQLLASYERPYAIYFIDDSATNASDVASGNLIYALSPVDALGINARLSRATTRQLTLADPELTTVGTQPSGDNTLLTTNLSQNLIHDFSQEWRFTEDLGGTMVYPLDTVQEQATRWVVNANISADYRFDNDSLGIVASHGFVITEAVSGTQSGSNLAINALDGRWRRDLAPPWTIQLGAGVSSAVNLDNGLYYAGPTWAAQLSYAADEFSVNFTYNRAIVPNVIAGPTALTDTLQVVGGLPLGLESNVTLQGIVGGSYNQLLTLDSDDPTPAVFSWTGDVALTWAPPTLPAFSLRYQHIQQFEPTVESQQLRAFSTNSATFAVSYQLPNANIPRVRRMASARVDAADSTPLGERQPAEQQAQPNTGNTPAAATQ